MPSGPRSTRRTPSRRSRRWICFVKADGLRNSALAARPSVPLVDQHEEAGGQLEIHVHTGSSLELKSQPKSAPDVKAASSSARGVGVPGMRAYNLAVPPLPITSDRVRAADVVSLQELLSAPIEAATVSTWAGESPSRHAFLASTVWCTISWPKELGVPRGASFASGSR